MGVISDKLNQLRAELARKIAPKGQEDDQPTRELMRQRISEARDVVGLTQHPGWKVLEAHLVQARDEQLRALLDMDADRFATPLGTQVKGFVNGLDAALDAAVVIVTVGQEAEKILEQDEPATINGGSIRPR